VSTRETVIAGALALAIQELARLQNQPENWVGARLLGQAVEARRTQHWIEIANTLDAVILGDCDG